ncbi:Hypothetical_protein [Hexamita inflata]|uniref:Hypothetical_protein n=1 Tax=Hexamita inflata TaxID=28002 RepID=A0AA86R6H5_9EUKA|nr:Hypothetical protein HINF_LOCUS54504 [Hexamita inflata]
MQELKESKQKINNQLCLLRQKLKYNSRVNKSNDLIQQQIDQLIQSRKQLQIDYDHTNLNEAQLAHKEMLHKKYLNYKQQAQLEGRRYYQLEQYYKNKDKTSIIE